MSALPHSLFFHLFRSSSPSAPSISPNAAPENTVHLLTQSPRHHQKKNTDSGFEDGCQWKDDCKACLKQAPRKVLLHSPTHDRSSVNHHLLLPLGTLQRKHNHWGIPQTTYWYDNFPGSLEQRAGREKLLRQCIPTQK